MGGASAIDAALPGALETLIDVNVGQNRCGVAPEDALALADRIRGLGGSAWSDSRATKATSSTCATPRSAGAVRPLDGTVGGAAEELRAGGHTIDVVSTGGTGTAEFCAATRP